MDHTINYSTFITTMIKALFFDVDGTLVSFKTHTIPQSAIDAIHEVREKGIKVFIATGRPIPFINNLDGLEYDGIMSVNGACFTTNEGETVFCKTVPHEDVKKIYDYAKENGLPVTFASRTKAYSINSTETSDEVFKLLNIELPLDTYDLETNKEEIMQVIAFFTETQEQYILNNILTHCDAHRWHPHFADCILKGTSKASGIDEVIKYYGIELSETMAFGDGGNDIQMLEHAGIGVAMGNATEEVKKYAKLVTDSVDNDGIAKILCQIQKF